MELGTFTRHEDGTFSGTATTLLSSFDLEYRPIEKVGNGPDFRVYRLGTEIEVGAAWIEVGNFSKKEYLSTLVDTPEFANGAWMALVTEEDGSYVLKWSRPNPNRKRAGQNGSAENGQTAGA